MSKREDHHITKVQGAAQSSPASSELLGGLLLGGDLQEGLLAQLAGELSTLMRAQYRAQEEESERRHQDLCSKLAAQHKLIEQQRAQIEQQRAQIEALSTSLRHENFTLAYSLDTLSKRFEGAPLNISKRYYLFKGVTQVSGPHSLSDVVSSCLAAEQRAQGPVRVWCSEAKAWVEHTAVPEIEAWLQMRRAEHAPPLETLSAPLSAPRFQVTLTPNMRGPLLFKHQPSLNTHFYERLIPAQHLELDWIDSFLMMETQVTQALYEEVMKSNPSYFKGRQHPVERVSYWDATRFANALSERCGLEPAYQDGSLKPAARGYRLPSLAEWTWAAQGGEAQGREITRYAGSNKLAEVGWFIDHSDHQTHAVAQLKPNGYGLYDMSGNVWEWCEDRVGGAVSGSHMDRYVLGGGWSDQEGACQLKARHRLSPFLKTSSDVGFRLCRRAPRDITR